jgi:hypothetical protein
MTRSSQNLRWDWQCDEAVESVTFTQGSTGTAPAGVKASRRQRKVALLEGQPGAPEHTVTTWRVWDATMPAGVTPDLGDTITDGSGAVWTINDVQTNTVSGTVIHHDCTCDQQ